DDSQGAAENILRNGIVYDASIHTPNSYSQVPSFGSANASSRIALFRIDITNNSPADYNTLRLESLNIYLDKGTAPLDTGQAGELFDSMFVAYNSTDSNKEVVFEKNRDTFMGEIDSQAFNLSEGKQKINVDTEAASRYPIEPGSTETFFAGVELSSSADTSSVDVFRAQIDTSSDTVIAEDISGVRQDFEEVSLSTTIEVTPVGEVQSDWTAVSESFSNVAGTPYIDNIDTGNVYTGSEDGIFTALTGGGAKKWSYTAEGPVRSNIYGDTGDGSIYFGDAGGYIHKLRDDGDSYSLLWERSLKDKVNSVVEREYVYATTSGGDIYKLKPDTGESVSGWDGQLSGDLTGQPAVQDGWRGVSALWAASTDNNVYRLQLSDGTITSNFTAEDSIYTSPVINTGKYNEDLETNFLFVPSDDGRVYCRTSGNLSTIPDGWKDRTDHPDGAFETGAPIKGNIHKGINQSSLYFGNDDGKLYRVDMVSGTLKWNQPFQAEGAIRTGPVMLPGNYLDIDNDYVYFGDSKGYLYAVSSSDGLTMRDGFPYYLGASIISPPVVDKNTNRLYVGTSDGRLHAINIGP
ncbi:MAG: PQQ-binding-like beta-propeller repeat protein, partial [Elusimicrobiota bacterium]